MCTKKCRFSHRPDTWLTVTLLLVVQSVAAQSMTEGELHSVGPETETVCVLAPVMDDTGVRYVPHESRHSKTLAPTSTFSVTFLDEDPAEPWPVAARAAVEYAKGIWETVIVSPQEIRVNAYWADRGGCTDAPVTLGSAGARALHRDFGAFPHSNTWYVDALADVLSGLDMGGSTQPDIRVYLNKDCDDPNASTHWYFGTDGSPPAGSIDLVSVVLHELGHGLGVSGAGRVTSGTGTVRYSTRPYAYDRFTVDGSMPYTGLMSYPDFSVELGAALQSGNGGVLYDGSSATSANGGESPSLYTPTTWKGGSSYSHLDEQTYNNTTNALMTPMLSTMEANHVIGPVTCGVLEDMGWTVSMSNCDLSLPVELTEFRAVVDGADVVLKWETASESDNAGFEIERRNADDRFVSVGYVPGAGHSVEQTTYETRIPDPGAGTHAFRLRQVDLDGGSTYSPVVEITVEMAAMFELTAAYPNPFNPSTRFSLSVQKSQNVRVDVIDMLGRTVATLFDGSAVAGERHEMHFEAINLPSGVYVYRALGESFAASRTMMLMK